MPKNNTVIHKSFSKKDLLKVIQEFDITIGVDESYTKSTVANTLWGILTKLDFLYIPPDNNYLVKDLIGLRCLLKHPNPRKPFSVKDRDRYTMVAKKINHYCENNFDIKESVYTNIKQVYNDADEISQYGDIPIIRKTLRKLMYDPQKLYTIKPRISPHIQHDMKMKQMLCKKSKFYKCEVKTGSFIITFD